MIGGDFLGGGNADDFGCGIFGFLLLEDDEVTDQVEQGVFVEHPVGEDVEFVGIGYIPFWKKGRSKGRRWQNRRKESGIK